LAPLRPVAREFGVKRNWPAHSDIAAIENLGDLIAVLAGGPSNGSSVVLDGWTTGYPAR
jgi:hypothetical protein